MVSQGDAGTETSIALPDLRRVPQRQPPRPRPRPRPTHYVKLNGCFRVGEQRKRH